MKKQLLPFLTMLLSASAATAADGDVFTINELMYTVTSETDRHVSVEAVDKATISGDVIIPSSVTNNGVTYSVTEIPVYGFSRGYLGNDIQSIEFPNTLTAIGSNAFIYCKGLKTITLPSSLSELGEDVFGDCTNITEFVMEQPNDYFSTDDGVLLNGDKTVIVLCPPARTGKYIVPSTVTEIGSRAFKLCRSSVELPNTVTRINDYAFQQCWGLVGSFTIPNSVTYLGAQAFFNCLNLTSVVISSSLTQIKEFTFSMCTSLREIVDYNPVPQTLERRAFYNVPADAVVYVPKGCVEVYSTAEGWDYFSDFREIKTTTIDEIISDMSGDIDDNAPYEIYNINGMRVSGSIETLAPGLYIIRQANLLNKIIVR